MLQIRTANNVIIPLRCHRLSEKRVTICLRFLDVRSSIRKNLALLKNSKHSLIFDIPKIITEEITFSNDRLKNRQVTVKRRECWKLPRTVCTVKCGVPSAAQIGKT